MTALKPAPLRRDTMASMTDDPNLTYCADLVRRSDPDRFFASLLAPAEQRAGLLTLYAFYQEVARIPELVKEPMIGAIRQQWWRDAVARLAQDGRASHPVAHALAPLLDQGLSPEGLLALIDAREGDFAEVPFATRDDREAYARKTAGGLMRAAFDLLCHPARPSTADLALAEEAGALWARLGLLRSVAFWAARRRLVLPWEAVAAAGIDLEPLFAGTLSQDGRDALSEIILDEAALVRMGIERLSGRAIPLPLRPALCYIPLSRAYVRHVERAACTPLATPASPRTATRIVSLLWAAGRCRM
ncbi:MAG: phytoene/squalene synthase family protein [Alphaproteobacteria bacterium]